MDIEKTKEYYVEMKREDICDCIYCQNLIDEVKQAYPDVAAYLLSFGVNIERPFEVFLPIEDHDNGYMDYPIVQYLMVGNSSDFKETNASALYYTSNAFLGETFAGNRISGKDTGDFASQPLSGCGDRDRLS